jgi:hypothetical protein
MEVAGSAFNSRSRGKHYLLDFIPKSANLAQFGQGVK